MNKIQAQIEKLQRRTENLEKAISHDTENFKREVSETENPMLMASIAAEYSKRINGWREQIEGNESVIDMLEKLVEEGE